ncbi:MAG: LacI family transcriptional regulator [Pseudonocardiaceae bacterium]|nr:MAG: LacI family transcriptional regulator [Pseudonocardiaceae bacterium]
MADRRPRLEDVAAAVGVSTASVSLVLRGAPGPSAGTREKVLDAATRLGYRPDRAASLLARRRSRLLGVMLEVRSSFHAELVEDLHEVAETRGYDLVLSTVTRTRDEARAVETLVDSRCEALILLGPDAPAPRLAALDAQLPVVVVGRPMPATAGVDVVRAADDEGTARAVEYLAELGHSEIVHVDGGPTDIASGRVRGYRDAMARLGVEPRVVPGDQTEEAGIEAARTLLDGDELPTAVVCFNDRIAIGLLDALVRAGVDVPGRVSVIGYDDSPLARLAHVDLTTVSQNTHEMTERAVELAVERLEGDRSGHREVVLPPTLVVRGTTAPPCAR